MARIPQELEEDAAMERLGEEVSIILKHHMEQIKSEAAQGIEQPSIGNEQMIADTFAYVDSLKNYSDKEKIDAAHSLKSSYGWLSEWEFAVINNLRIDDVDECLSLLPTVRLKVERGDASPEQLEAMLAEIKRYQTVA